MSQGDNFLHRIEGLRKTLDALESGVPSEIVAICYDSEKADEARQDALDYHGIDESILESGHIKVEVATFDWCKGRGVGITDSRDPAIPEAISESVDRFHKGRHMKQIRGSQKDIEGDQTP